MVETKVTARPGPLRCPFCHDGVTEETGQACACGAVYHRDCLAENGRCATIGCGGTVAGPASHLSVLSDEPRHRIVGTNVRAPFPRDPVALDRSLLATLIVTGASAALGARLGYCWETNLAVAHAVAGGWSGLFFGSLLARAIRARSAEGGAFLAVAAPIVGIVADVLAHDIAYALGDAIFVSAVLATAVWVVTTIVSRRFA